MTYSEKLKHPKWQKKRLEILQRDNFKCTLCDNSEKTLHVHHDVYIGKNPWDTPSDCLNTLCEDCHTFEHELKNYTPLERFLIECLITRETKDFYPLLIKHSRLLKNTK